jgi:ABC-type amino acid transport substrate-binding protein
MALVRQTAELLLVEFISLRRFIFLTVVMGVVVVWTTPHSAAAPSAPAQSIVAHSKLTDVRERGVVRCGVSEGLPGFSEKDKNGEWVGFDVDLCRALAAAIFNDPSKVAVTPVSAANRFSLLISGAIDVLSRDTTCTLSREAGAGDRIPCRDLV